MKKVILLGVACLLAACASLEKVSTALNTKWAGKSYDEFVMERGVARNSQKLSNGMTMYLFEEEGVVGGYNTLTTVHCTLNILVDTNNYIKSIKANGDAGICNEKFDL